MKKSGILLLVLLLALSFSFAHAETQAFYGTLTYKDNFVCSSNITGTVESVHVKEGQKVKKGDVLFTFLTDKVYAPVSGTVQGVSISEGDLVDNFVQRNGALCYIQEELPFVFHGSTRSAYNNDMRDISIGDTLYVKNSNGEKKGTFIIQTISDTSFTALLLEGNFEHLDNVTAYKKEQMIEKYKVSSGTVKRAQSTPVTGSGTLLHTYVKNGDPVQKGQLLFETLQAPYANSMPFSNQIFAENDMVVQTLHCADFSPVQKDTPLITYAKQNTLCALLLVDENDIHLLKENTPLSITLDSDEQSFTHHGEVDFISHKNVGTSSNPMYQVYVTLQNTLSMMEGMTVTAHLQ